MKKHHFLSGISVAAFMFLAACSGPVDDESVTEFVTKASVANLFEIESSRLALERSTNPEVKALAQKILSDHMKAGEDLSAALTTGNSTLTPAATMDEAHQKLYDDLRDASAEDFDDKYLDIQTKAHDEAIALFKDYADGGKEGPVKAFAATTLPTLESHKDHVKSVDESTDDDDMSSSASADGLAPVMP